MNIAGSIQTRNTYLYAEVSGTFEIKQAKQFTRKVLDILYESDLPKVFIDARQLKGDISTMQRFEYGAFLSSAIREIFASGEKIQPRLAIVADISILDRQRFVEIVARNRGTSIKVTDNIDEAYEWLGESPSEPPTGDIIPITDNGEN